MNLDGLITILRRLFHIRRTKHSFESTRYLLKGLLISTLIGLVAGVGAIAFYAAIHFSTAFFLGRLIGYLPPDPAGEGVGKGVMPFWSAVRPWLLPLITAGGGLVAGIIVFNLAPEAEGHGTDAALETLTSQRVSWAPVVDTEVPMSGQQVIGTLSAASIIRLYRQTLTKDSRRMRGLVEGTVMVETMVKSAMPLAHVSLREAHLPAGCLVVSIRRQDELLFPQGSIVILPDDIVTFLVNPRGEEQLQHYLTEPSSQTIEPVALD